MYSIGICTQGKFIGFDIFEKYVNKCLSNLNKQDIRIVSLNNSSTYDPPLREYCEKYNIDLFGTSEDILNGRISLGGRSYVDVVLEYVDYGIINFSRKDFSHNKVINIQIN